MTDELRARIDPEPVHIAGPVTWDRFADRALPGGAVTYAALVATAFDVRAHVLVNAASDLDRAALGSHDVHLVDGAHTLIYEHTFDDRVRRLRLVQAPGVTLSPADVPAAWPEPRTLILAPLLLDDLDAGAFIADSPAGEIALLAQGLQRRTGADGWIEVLPEPAPSLTAALNERVSVFLSAEEVAPWPAGAIERLAQRARRVIVTRGRDGADLHAGGAVTHIPARAAHRVDPTGAGDVFATAFILAVRAGEQRAGRIASAYAAAGVERRGPAPLPPLQQIIATLDAPAAGGVSRPNTR